MLRIISALRHGSHSFTCKCTVPAFSFVAFNRCHHPAEVADIQLQLTTHLLTLKLSWPSWLTCSGWLTHISDQPSAAGRAQDRESSPAKDRRSTAEPPYHPNSWRQGILLAIVLKICLSCFLYFMLMRYLHRTLKCILGGSVLMSRYKII